MSLQNAVRSVFAELAGSLTQFSAAEYGRSCALLSDHSVGQHVRHIIELFQCLENGYDEGTVNYEKRRRDPLIETDKDLACRWLEKISLRLDRANKELLLEAGYTGEAGDSRIESLSTNYYREIAYNLEHTIHHMALIRIGMQELNAGIVLPESFGISSSTLTYRKKCVQ